LVAVVVDDTAAGLVDGDLVLIDEGIEPAFNVTDGDVDVLCELVVDLFGVLTYFWHWIHCLRVVFGGRQPLLSGL